MGQGFYVVMCAQFFSALADNALLIAAIYILQQTAAPAEQIPLLKFFFTISYVVLAAFVGEFADSMPKWRVMFISNSIKIIGCVMMLFGFHPLAAYAIVGLGAAAYSPAKYGILTEMLPPAKLVIANGWIEGLTVGAIILGTLLGGAIIRPQLTEIFLPLVPTSMANAAHVAMLIVIATYVIAALFNIYIPDTGVQLKPFQRNPLAAIYEFNHCLSLLWRDHLGQISLAVTTLFWGAGATLQFIVIDWANLNLALPLSDATNLQGIVAIGIAIGSVLAARVISLAQSPSVIPLGIAMGLIVNLIVFVHDWYIAMMMMVIIGALAGFFVVPMNALLQHRGHVLMGAGHSIAVQNFNENLSILLMTGLYAFLIKHDFSTNSVIVAFGLFVAGTMYLVKLRHTANQRANNLEIN